MTESLPIALPSPEPEPPPAAEIVPFGEMVTLFPALNRLRSSVAGISSGDP
ncbi:MAG: hypothetical protein INR62_08590 [Rhodospirillales bacterium]|nr:hypothetical protein [Acetobacter sp.]